MQSLWLKEGRGGSREDSRHNMHQYNMHLLHVRFYHCHQAAAAATSLRDPCVIVVVWTSVGFGNTLPGCPFFLSFFVTILASSSISATQLSCPHDVLAVPIAASDRRRLSVSWPGLAGQSQHVGHHAVSSRLRDRRSDLCPVGHRGDNM